MKKLLIWLPRIAAIALLIFISMFALDVFSEGYALTDLLLALFMHLLPSLILLGLTAASWRCPKIGGIFFLFAAIFAGIFFHADTVFNFYAALPLFLIGGLFIASDIL